MIAKLAASLADPDFKEGFEWGREASQDESAEGPISEDNMLAFIRNECDPVTLRRDATFTALTGVRQLSLRHKYGFLAGYILATYTDAEAFLVEPARPVLKLVASHS